MSHHHNGSGVAGLFNDKINFALAELALQQAEHFDFFGKWLVCRSGAGAHQQVNVAAFFAVVHARAK